MAINVFAQFTTSRLEATPEIIPPHEYDVCGPTHRTGDIGPDATDTAVVGFDDQRV